MYGTYFLLDFCRFLKGVSVKVQDSFHQEEYWRSGRGLAIYRKVADLHQGKIPVDREKGIGSVFSIRIPEILWVS